MRYLALWYGGSNYANPDPENPKDREYFTSIREAARTLQAREDFDQYYPCVSDSEMHLYKGGEYHENGPDYVLTIGPRGGVKVSR